MYERSEGILSEEETARLLSDIRNSVEAALRRQRTIGSPFFDPDDYEIDPIARSLIDRANQTYLRSQEQIYDRVPAGEEPNKEDWVKLLEE